MVNSNIKYSMVEKFLQMKIENQQNLFFHPSYSLEQQLLHAISRGELKEAKSTLDRINKHERPLLSKDALRSLKYSLIGSCTLFTRAIIKGGVEPESAFNLSDVFIRKIDETREFPKLIQLEYEMLEGFIYTMRHEQTKNYQFIVNKAISFIHKEILSELSLEKIAHHVNVHPSYLSHIFKAEVHDSLTEYICKKRIEDSKYFLTQSNMSISDIANLFRFCNQSYYTLKFKKQTGVTPRKFRNQHRNCTE